MSVEGTVKLGCFCKALDMLELHRCDLAASLARSLCTLTHSCICREPIC